MSEREESRQELIRQGMEGLFEDQKFSGDLLSRLFRMGMTEEEMDAIYKQAENDIIRFVDGLAADVNVTDALNGYLHKLKRQILKNPAEYVGD